MCSRIGGPRSGSVAGHPPARDRARRAVVIALKGVPPVLAGMCTFILAWRVFDGVPVVVAANRDERLDRPSRPPALLSETPRIVAPQDLEAEGTWIGYNEHGVLASITNRWTSAALAGDRSRGLLVRDVLGTDSAAAAADLVRTAVDAVEYAGFNLVVVDARDAYLFEWDGDLRTTTFDPGVHIVVNIGADDDVAIPTPEDPSAEWDEDRVRIATAQAEDVRRAREVLAPDVDESAAAWQARARALLRDHAYGFCVHRSGFGTRSSSLIRLPAAGEPVFEYADGPPCERDVAYERVDVTA